MTPANADCQKLSRKVLAHRDRQDAIMDELRLLMPTPKRKRGGQSADNAVSETFGTTMDAVDNAADALEDLWIVRDFAERDVAVAMAKKAEKSPFTAASSGQ